MISRALFPRGRGTSHSRTDRGDFWEMSISHQISKQGCHGHQWSQLSSVSRRVLPTLRKENRCDLTVIRRQPHLTRSPRKLWMWKNRILAQDGWDTHESNDCSKPRLLPVLICRKVLNSLSWDTWLPLIDNNLPMFRLPALCCKTYM